MCLHVPSKEDKEHGTACVEAEDEDEDEDEDEEEEEDYDDEADYDEEENIDGQRPSLHGGELLSELQLLQCKVLWEEAIRGESMWRGLLRASRLRLQVYKLVTSQGWRRLFLSVCLLQVTSALVAIWQPFDGRQKTI